MRKTFLIGLGATVALVAAAAAAAAVFTAAGASSTSATLSSTQASGVTTRTCTGADGKTFAVTNGRYTGTASFSNPVASLDGPLTISARTTVDSGSKLGIVEGSFRIKDDNTAVTGKLWGTLDGTGKLAGFLVGASHGNNARVLGTLSGQFAPATGFVGNGLLGSAPSSTAFAVLVGPVCRGEKPKAFEIRGTLSAIGTSPASVTVAGKGPTTATCYIDAGSPSLSGFAVNDRVVMRCANVSSTWELRGLQKEKKGK